MKKNKFFEKSALTISCIMFAASVIMAIFTLLNFDAYSRKHYQQVQAYANEKNAIQSNCSYSTTDGVACNEKQVMDLSKEIAMLEQKRATLKSSLEKAKSDRDKNYGMVAGLSYQPSQSLNEVINLEKKISKVDHQITALSNKKEMMSHQMAQNR